MMLGLDFTVILKKALCMFIWTILKFRAKKYSTNMATGRRVTSRENDLLDANLAPKDIFACTLSLCKQQVALMVLMHQPLLK